jgi:hypothetical protein
MGPNLILLKPNLGESVNCKLLADLTRMSRAGSTSATAAATRGGPGLYAFGPQPYQRLLFFGAAFVPSGRHSEAEASPKSIVPYLVMVSGFSACR